MTIFVIGVNHKTAPLELREKIYFPLDKISLYLQDILNRGHAHEAVLISTCNRSELYVDSNDLAAVRDWFCAQSQDAKTLESVLYVYSNEDAVAHIMQVACGLDSMIVGEPQILGQLKEAYSESVAAGAVGSLFHRLFQQIFTIAKDIRTTTTIGACPVSVASAAVHFIKQLIPNFLQCNVVLIGAGDTSELLIRYLKGQLTSPITLVNRTTEKAMALVAEFGGRVYELDRLVAALATADVVFASTASAIPIVNKKILAEAMQSRDRPITLIDLAVPRDVDPAVLELANVNLFSIDDLKNMIEKNRHGREHAADKAQEMIRQKSAAFIQELQSFEKVANTIRAYRSQIEEMCHGELIKAKQSLQQGVDPLEVLNMFAHAYTNKLLHVPSVQLRQAGAEGRFDLLQLAKQLFAIPDPEVEEHETIH